LSGIAYFTTVAAAAAAVGAMESDRQRTGVHVRTLQEYHASI